MPPPYAEASMMRRKSVFLVAAAFLLQASVVPASADEYATAAELGLMQGFPPPPDKRVNKSNALMAPPFSRWSYQHMRMLYPSVGVPAADRPVELAKAIDEGIAAVGVRQPDPSGKPGGKAPGQYIPTDKTVDLAAYLRETYTDAIVVIKGDEIVYEAYFNGMGPDQPHQMMSCTKSFAGLFGLMAVAEGLLSESDPVVKYVPELKDAGGFKEATLGQVLNMTNSVRFSEDYADPDSDAVHYAIVLGWMEPQPGKKYADSLYSYLPTLAKDPAHEHGEVFHYQTPKTDVLNWVTNRATGESFQDALYNRLWSKLGTEGETYVLLDNNATLVAGGGLNATPHNLARFAVAMLNEGRFDGRQVIPPALIETIASGASTEAFSKGPEAHGIQGNGDWSYRAQWWVRHTPGKEAFTAIGIHGQWIYIDIAHKIAVIKQSSQPTSFTDYQAAYDILGFDAVIAHLTK
jgi:CubicO group peptidase (beta-lactamase class C family)